MKLLCISNGHGEDAIAIRILRALQQQPNPPELAALPIVGEGRAYAQLTNVPIIGPVRKMPSGGFIYMDTSQLLRDVQGGLLQLTLAQFRVTRNWVKNGGVILAVGDIVPLLFAWLSGARYVFVGTAKSEYYLRDEAGKLPRKSERENFEGWSGSVYLPWERCLMGSNRCQAVFPRDRLTTETLQKFSIRAFDLGNPMMDDLGIEKSLFVDKDIEKKENVRPLTVTLIPGSRAPEAYQNWQQIIRAVSNLIENYTSPNYQVNPRLLFLGAIAPGLSFEPLCQQLELYDWRKLENPDDLIFTYKNATLILSQNHFSEYLQRGDVAIAMAGTATEQFVGLGKPAIALPGMGPQFTPAFAEAQSRLLGPSLILVERPTQVGQVVQRLFSDPDWLYLIAENGYRRMGTPGASVRIAKSIMEKLGEMVC